MTTALWHNSLENQEVHQESWDLSVSYWVIIDTWLRIKDILCSQDKNQLDFDQQLFLDLCWELQQEVSKVSRKIKYKYNTNNYINRLCQNSKVLKSTYSRLLKENSNLKLVINRILKLFKDPILKQALKDNLYKEYIEYLVYEGIKDNELCEFKDIFINGDEFDNSTISKQFGARLLSSTRADLRRINLDSLFSLKEQDMRTIFSYFRNILHVDLSSIEFSTLNEEQLRFVFKGFRNLKGIDLSSDLLNQLNEEQLKAIFENLRNVMLIDISNNKLHELGNDKLKIIYWNLVSLKCIENSSITDVTNNWFSDEQMLYIKSLLPKWVIIKS